MKEQYDHPSSSPNTNTEIVEQTAIRRSPLRALAVGTILCLIIGIGAPISTHLLRGSYIDLDFSTPAAVFFLFVLVALVNPLLRRLGRIGALEPGEILVIYSMMIVACALTTMGMASQLVPTLAAVRYYSHNHPDWSTHVLPYIRHWLLPDAHASDRLFTGLNVGEPIPWAAWLVPLTSWGVLLIAFYTMSLCLMAIFRRPWVERERLAYPLTQLPLEIVRPKGPGNETPLLRNGVMWLGFATAFLAASMRGLHHYFPVFPDCDPVWHIPVFRDPTQLALRISLPMIGFFFLANPEAVFSLWFFNRIAWTVQGWMNMVGTEYRADLGPYSAPPIFGYLALGAFLGLAFTTARSAWPHLRRVTAAALHPGSIRGEDAEEPMAYRTAFWGVIGGLLVMAGWLWMIGVPPFVVPLFLIGVVAIFLALTRVVIESGMAEAISPTGPAGFTHAALGSRMIGAQGMAALSLSYLWAGDVRTVVMTSAAHGFRLSEALPGHRRALTGGMFLALFITAPIALFTTLYLAYTHGGVSLNHWFFIDGPQLPYKWIAEQNLNPTNIDYGGWILMVCGALFAGFLALMRGRFLWWPLHPVGFVIAPTWIVDEIWLSAFLAWLARSLLVRYGGLQGFQKLRPYFLGLILGQFTCNGFWLILDALTGARGNQVFWI